MTPAQVRSFNDYQALCSAMHPYTCELCRRPMQASESGLQCLEPGCGHTQSWASPSLLDDSWRRLAAAIADRNRART